MLPSLASETSYVRTLIEEPSLLQSTRTTNSIIATLNLQPHPEGGYFVETDRDPLGILNPFLGTKIYPNATVKHSSDTDNTPTRNASTTIHYYLDPARPFGVFHRNKGRTVHTHHHGRGLYIIIHADEVTARNPHARIESFIVGPNVENGERIQWIVEGGKFKASLLLPDLPLEESGSSSSVSTASPSSTSGKGLLISETVVPGFDFMDHDFLSADGLQDLLGDNTDSPPDLQWLLRENREKDLR